MEKDWNLLKQVFGATNEIRRKKNNLDLIDIKYILFDKRLRKYEEFLPLVKQRHIQINIDNFFDCNLLAFSNKNINKKIGFLFFDI